MRYLSDEWLEAATEAVASIDPLPEDITIGFVIGPEDPTSYAIDLGTGPVRYHREMERAGLTLHLSRPTAVAVATGELSAQRAFLDGELRVGGDVRLLLGHAQQLGALDDRLADVRAATDFGAETG